MNVIWLDDAVRSFDTVDIAVAVASDRGLMTPVVRDVARRGIAAVAADTRDLAARARDGKLKQEELEGGSLSISNLGMYGTDEFSAIINPHSPPSWRSARPAASPLSSTASSRLPRCSS